MQKNNDKTVVVFRKWRNGNVLALFPYELCDSVGKQCMSYEHVGQHGAADYSHCIDSTVPALPSQYQALYKELESIGYDLEVKQKVRYSRFSIHPKRELL